MSILLHENARLIVQGITGYQGQFHTHQMKEYGTEVVAGVTPGKSGMDVEGVPVYDTVEEAMQEHDANTSIIFVPAPFAKDAGIESLEEGLDPVIVITEGLPVRDEIGLVNYAKEKGAHVIGPNTPGVISAGKSKAGIMPSHIFKPGSIGIVSRSGTLTYEIAADISNIGLGQTTCLGIGGDPVTGLNFIEVLEMFENDPETEAIIMIGEIGGSAEEDAAEYIKEHVTKPVAAFIAGRTAPPGKRMGHAGAIVAGDAGTAQAKIDALNAADVQVGSTPEEVAKIIKEQA